MATFPGLITNEGLSLTVFTTGIAGWKIRPYRFAVSNQYGAFDKTRTGATTFPFWYGKALLNNVILSTSDPEVMEFELRIPAEESPPNPEINEVYLYAVTEFTEITAMDTSNNTFEVSPDLYGLLNNDDVVKIRIRPNNPGLTLPTRDPGAVEMDEDGEYYVIKDTGSNIKLSDTAMGTPIDVTAVGTAFSAGKLEIAKEFLLALGQADPLNEIVYDPDAEYYLKSQIRIAGLDVGDTFAFDLFEFSRVMVRISNVPDPITGLYLPATSGYVEGTKLTFAGNLISSIQSNPSGDLEEVAVLFEGLSKLKDDLEPTLGGDLDVYNREINILPPGSPATTINPTGTIGGSGSALYDSDPAVDFIAAGIIPGDELTINSGGTAVGTITKVHDSKTVTTSSLGSLTFGPGDNVTWDIRRFGTIIYSNTTTTGKERLYRTFRVSDAVIDNGGTPWEVYDRVKFVNEPTVGTILSISNSGPGYKEVFLDTPFKEYSMDNEPLEVDRELTYKVSNSSMYSLNGQGPQADPLYAFNSTTNGTFVEGLRGTMGGDISTGKYAFKGTETNALLNGNFVQTENLAIANYSGGSAYTTLLFGDWQEYINWIGFIYGIENVGLLVNPYGIPIDIIDPAAVTAAGQEERSTIIYALTGFLGLDGINAFNYLTGETGTIYNSEAGGYLQLGAEATGRVAFGEYDVGLQTFTNNYALTIDAPTDTGRVLQHFSGASPAQVDWSLFALPLTAGGTGNALIRGAGVSSIWTGYSFPSAGGSNQQVLIHDGAGNLVFGDSVHDIQDPNGITPTTTSESLIKSTWANAGIAELRRLDTDTDDYMEIDSSTDYVKVNFRGLDVGWAGSTGQPAFTSNQRRIITFDNRDTFTQDDFVVSTGPGSNETSVALGNGFINKFTTDDGDIEKGLNIRELNIFGGNGVDTRVTNGNIYIDIDSATQGDIADAGTTGGVESITGGDGITATGTTNVNIAVDGDSDYFTFSGGQLKWATQVSHTATAGGQRAIFLSSFDEGIKIDADQGFSTKGFWTDSANGTGSLAPWTTSVDYCLNYTAFYAQNGEIGYRAAVCFTGVQIEQSVKRQLVILPQGISPTAYPGQDAGTVLGSYKSESKCSPTK
jgi:hypothetical protein